MQTSRETRTAGIRRSEKQVVRTDAAINSFNNPFSIADKAKLYCNSSGAPASVDVENYVLQAETAGL